MLNMASPRYRMLLNDGQHQALVMAATQLTEYMATRAAVKGSVVHISELISNVVQGKRCARANDAVRHRLPLAQEASGWGWGGAWHGWVIYVLCVSAVVLL